MPHCSEFEAAIAEDGSVTDYCVCGAHADEHAAALDSVLYSAGSIRATRKHEPTSEEAIPLDLFGD